jgi:hypothetical protein
MEADDPDLKRAMSTRPSTPRAIASSTIELYAREIDR